MRVPSLFHLSQRFARYDKTRLEDKCCTVTKTAEWIKHRYRSGGPWERQHQRRQPACRHRCSSVYREGTVSIAKKVHPIGFDNKGRPFLAQKESRSPCLQGKVEFCAIRKDLARVQNYAPLQLSMFPSQNDATTNRDIPWDR